MIGCFQNLIEAAAEAFDSFLERYPYCYGYWKKYADMEKRRNRLEEAEKVCFNFLISELFCADEPVQNLTYFEKVIW